MKKLFFIATLVFIILAIQTANAQNPITTLEHTGTTTVFYGQNSLVDAYTASVNGDYLYLSTGYFTAPTAIAKGVKIIGAGHFPDSANVARRTTIITGISINKGADSLLLEGLYINGNVSYQSDASINFVKVFRCRLESVLFNSSSDAASKNNCSYEECFINNNFDFHNYGVNLKVYHSIISGSLGVFYINGSSLIDGNIFLENGYTVQYVNGSLIKNNIFIKDNNYIFTCNSSIFANNLFVNQSVNFGSNLHYNNYTGIAQSNIFVNQTGNTIDYTHDYHLKNPITYLGTDGTQVGLYGGTTPFKDKGAPSNPQILTKTVGDQTDTNGNLQINFKIKAQDN